eukprot:jgi/Orpsp1_1/1177243/evm.model.c7180000060680.1
MGTNENKIEVIGNYRLISEIGKGSFAIVYKGEKIDKEKEKNKDKKGEAKKTLSYEKLEINNINSSKLKKCSSDSINNKNENNTKEDSSIIPNTIAIKSIIKERLNNKLLVNLKLEINILKNIKHQHIVQLYNIEHGVKTINLLMEYCAYGDLSSYMKKHFSKRNNNPLIGPWKGFNEYIVLEFLFQLTSALKYMNEKGVVHRDLKPQNILLTFDPNRKLHPIPKPIYLNPTSYCIVSLPFLKLADFGFARPLPSENLASTLCGSPLYMAPEILDNKKYSANVDLWSLGTILYELVMSRTPYSANNYRDLLEKIKRSNGIYFPGDKNKTNSKIDSSDDDLVSKADKDNLIIEDFKNIISDSSDNEAIINNNNNDILNINQDQKNNENSNDLSKYSNDPNAFSLPFKELIRNLLKKKSEERISFQDFFDIVDNQLKPQWETYRKQFNDILIEKENELSLNGEIDFDFDKYNSKFSSFIPIPSNIKIISKQVETRTTTKINDTNNSDTNLTCQSNELSNNSSINFVVNEKHSSISSFDDSNCQIIQPDNIYSDGKDSSTKKEKNSVKPNEREEHYSQIKSNLNLNSNSNLKKLHKGIAFNEEQIKEKE